MGPNTKYQSLEESSQAALTLAQLLKGTRHVKSQETLLPVYIGVMLHVKTRKNELIDRLHTDCMLLGCRFHMVTCFGYRQLWQMQFVNTSRKRHGMSPQPQSQRAHYSLLKAHSTVLIHPTVEEEGVDTRKQ